MSGRRVFDLALPGFGIWLRLSGFMLGCIKDAPRCTSEAPKGLQTERLKRCEKANVMKSSHEP